MDGVATSVGRVRDALRRVAANRSLRRVEVGWLVAIAAEWAYLVSLLVFAYDVGGVIAVGLLSTLRMLPAAVLAPILTSQSVKWPRARVLASVHAFRGVAVAVAAIAVLADLPFAVIAAAATAEGIVATLHRPTTMALLPSLARSPEELIASNAMTSTGEAMGLLLGPAIGGLLLGLGGPALGLAVPALAFGMALVAVVHMDARGSVGVPEVGRRGMAGMLAGFVALRSYPSAGSLVAIFISQTFIRGILTVLLVAASVELLGLGRSGVGYLNSAMGAGSFLGAMVAFSLIVRRDLSLPFSISLAAWGIPIVVIGVLPESVLAFAFLGMLGAANAVLDVSGFTLLQRSVPNRLRAVVFGALESLVALSVAIGSLLAPILVALVDLQPAMVLTGMLLPIVAVVTNRLVRAAESSSVVPHRQLELLRGISMFAPLSLTALERLAGGMEPIAFEAGETIVRQGDVGYDYFMIGTGVADVVKDGKPIAVLKAGDGFGEIALLRNVPRTATVLVREGVEGFSLPRSVFLEAVTGNAASADEADRIAAERAAGAGA
ncbi:MAG: cyclic nucleotide-binding domain-containing protein [Chloroflexota bacterium]|nr:cyclic nucleotide-binding domain-containing protein [Chloroflexota bacterium]